GILRADAAPTESGASLSIDVDTIAGRAGQAGRVGQAGEVAERAEALRLARPEPVAPRRTHGDPAPAQRVEGRARTSGGIVGTVVGALVAARLDDWRAGRRVRVPVSLHRAARYLDPGVPDHERALARRGTTLVGSVKSGALVEVLARGGFAS